MKELTTFNFSTEIFDYENQKEWKYLGSKPCIIDFYASWCAPCRMLNPILDEVEKEYGDKINIFKVNTESESELSLVFGIKSIPTLLFIPMNGEPRMAQGVISKENFDKIIKEVLGV